jgi:hypothetical protein
MRRHQALKEASQNVVDGLWQQIVRFKPVRRPQVQDRWSLRRQLGAQKVGEEAMVAIPLAPVVEGDEE